MTVRTGGDVLVAEILVEGNYETPYAQVGYGLREFEIDVVSRKPGEGAKRAFDKNVLAQTFRTFDADGSGEVDADELKAAANKFGIPITDEEVDATMAELGKTRDDEINKTEFIAWFQSLAEDVRSTTPPCSSCLCEHEQASVLKLRCCSQSDSGGSKIEQMQRSSITTASSIGFLSTNLVRAGYSAAEALVGDASLGSMLSSCGCRATPSCDAPLPSHVLKPAAGADGSSSG